MKRFHLLVLVASLLLFSPATCAVRWGFPAPATGVRRVFHPPVSTSAGRGFESQKRKVPTGSNPLHNKR
ncbi:hypothetical protein NMG60_11035398 [Bertholletia excelsa]